jgi:hypothetical protein
MSTNSSISTKIDNKIISIYCHWDGYLEHNGKLLVENYKTLEAVKELLDLGYLSSLGKTINECVAYHRDRDEELEQDVYTIDLNENDFITQYKIATRTDKSLVYDYYFNVEDNQWYLFSGNGFVLITREMYEL